MAHGLCPFAYGYREKPDSLKNVGNLRLPCHSLERFLPFFGFARRINEICLICELNEGPDKQRALVPSLASVQEINFR